MTKTEQNDCSLPPSVLIKTQSKTWRKDMFKDGKPFTIIVTVRYDDQCGNGHNTFAITANLFGPDRDPGETTLKHESGKSLWCYSSGCCHEEIAEHFPGLAPFIKWHLTGSDGPMHYIGNTVYLAGARDHNGLLKDEFRQHTSRGRQNGGVEGVPNWVLEIPESIQRDVYAITKPEPITLKWKAYGRTGEGKVRELDAARQAAVWLEATDEDLTAPGLEQRLLARLPALMAEFKTAVEFFGFVY